MYTKAAVLATSATSLPMWDPEGYRMVPLPNMVADFRDRMRDISFVLHQNFLYYRRKIRTGRQVMRLPTISATGSAQSASRQSCGRLLELSEWRVNISRRPSLHCHVPGSFVTDSENAYS